MAEENPTPPPSNTREPHSSTPSTSVENIQRDDLPTSEARNDEKEESTEHLPHQSNELPQDSQPKNLASSSLINNENAEEIYWNSLSLNEKRSFLEVGFSDLLDFSKKISMGEELLLEAVYFYQLEEQWECWICCVCGRKFTDSESHYRHVVRAHLNNSLPLDHTLILPVMQEDWISMINDGNWEAANISGTVKILRQQLMLLSNESHKAESDPKQYIYTQSWPLAHDPARLNTLKKLQTTLQELLSAKHLMKLHVVHMLNVAVSRLLIKHFVPEFKPKSVLGVGLDQSHLSVCLLGASDLQEISKVVMKISGTLQNMSKTTSAMDGNQDCKNTTVNIGVENEMLHVVFDHHSETPNKESDSILSWIVSSPSSEQYLESWASSKQAKGIKELITFKKLLQNLKQDLDVKKGDYGAELNERGKMYRKVAAVIHLFAITINSSAAADYQKVLLFLVKSYMKARLEKYMKGTSDDEQQPLAPQGNDVHPAVTSEGNSDSENVAEDSKMPSNELTLEEDITEQQQSDEEFDEELIQAFQELQKRGMSFQN